MTGNFIRNSHQLDGSQFNTSTEGDLFDLRSECLGTRVTLCKVVVVSPFDPCFLVTSSPSHRRAVVTSRPILALCSGTGLLCRFGWDSAPRFSTTPLNRNSVQKNPRSLWVSQGTALRFHKKTWRHWAPWKPAVLARHATHDDARHSERPAMLWPQLGEELKAMTSFNKVRLQWKTCETTQL